MIRGMGRLTDLELVRAPPGTGTTNPRVREASKLYGSMRVVAIDQVQHGVLASRRVPRSAAARSLGYRRGALGAELWRGRRPGKAKPPAVGFWSMRQVRTSSSRWDLARGGLRPGPHREPERRSSSRQWSGTSWWLPAPFLRL